MKPDKAELKAALQDKASNYGGGNSIADYEVFKHAAEYLLSIMDDLDEMIEAREFLETKEAEEYGGDDYWVKFYATAANAMARIANLKTNEGEVK